MTDLLAVYGTLMRGLAPPFAPALHGRVVELGACLIPGTLHDCGPYPALLPTPALPGVRGELLRLVDADLLVELDAYEGYRADAAPTGSLFVRVRARLLEPEVDAWVYHGGSAHRTAAVRSGDWRAHLRARGAL